MYDYRENFRRLPLENVHNLRDLGGYASGRSGVTKWHVFLRSDNVHNISENDRKFLKGYGLTTVIDLRSADELSEKPNPFSTDKDVSYYNIPLIKTDMSTLISETAASCDRDKFRLSDLYIGILEQSKDSLKEVFKIFSKPESKCTLFHCTAGKDRTGVVAALLLSLADAPEEDIISNYEITNTHLRRVYGNIREMTAGLPATLVESSPENIEEFLVYLRKNYINAEKYLAYAGLSEEEIAAIKKKFINDSHQEKY